MPRKKRDFGESPRPVQGALADRLANELGSNRESGQPVIDEQEFPTGRIRVTVIWDEWNRLPHEDRTAVILKAYELAEGRDYRERIALASGVSFPEAHAAGMLPYQILPALRRDDPVTPEQCREAMIEEGASTLLADTPQLRFATLEDAEAAQARLTQRLPDTDQVWMIAKDVGRIDEWAHR